MAMPLALAKLPIAGLGTLTIYASVVLSKGTSRARRARAQVRRDPGTPREPLCLRTVRACAVKIFLAACAAVVGALAQAMDGAASACKAAVRSQSAAVEAMVEVAGGRPEALLHAAVELSGYAWEVARNAAWSSAKAFLDAARYVVERART